MKRIIKALLGGLGVSIVLCALFPSTFLKDDAKWTYQSDVGRVDVAFAGEVRDGKIDVQEKELRVDRPQGMRNSKGNQGIKVQFPISYLYKSYQITLTPSGEAKEISLVMFFRGRYLKVGNQTKPAYVCFENIRVNGKTVAEEQTVWHDKPFRYCAKNISDNSTVTVSFAVRKPLSFTDVSWDRFMGLFIVCSLLIFIAYSSIISRFDALKRLVSGFNKKDIVLVITDTYRNIDVVYRRAFWIILGFLSLAFGMLITHFMWGNHDFRYVGAYPLSWNGRAFEGRYAVYLFKKLFLGGIASPFACDVVTFLFLALNAVLLCIYWKLERRVIYFVLCGLILTVQPFTLSMMYFVHMLPEVFIGVTFALIALVIGEKIASDKSSCIQKVVFSFLSIVLINLSLGMYPVLLNTIAVVFIGRLLIQSFDWNGSWNQFKAQFTPFSVSAICVALGIVLYKGMVTFVFPLSKDMYNTQTLHLEQLPDRVLTLFKQCFHQLYEYPFPFISQSILWVFLGFTILIALYICSTGNIKQKIVRLILLVGALFATQTAMIIANKHTINGRVELFGLVVFETLVTVIVFTRLRKLHNLSILAVAGVIWLSIVDDLDCLRVWKLGFDAEKMLWNRVLARMEIQKDFDVNKKYNIIQIGMPISLRPRFYGKPWPKGGFDTSGGVQLMGSFDPPHDLFSAYTFYYQTEFRGEHYPPRPDRPNDPKYRAQLKRLWEAGILDKARAWPHENGLIVWEDTILFVTDAKLLEEHKKQLAQEFPRQSREAQ